MKRTIALWQIMGFSVSALGGTILHFLYDLLDEKTYVAPFSAVNESTWEHMKLIFWPMLIYTVIERFFFKDRKDFICIKTMGILLALILIPTIFYTYNGVIGKSADWINISIFFIALAIAYIYETKKFKEGAKCESSRLAIAILASLALLFVIFTFFPPKIEIFKDPITGGYGI